MNSKQIETARKEIEATRNEVNIRLQQRDNALFAYLTGAGILGGIAFANTYDPKILLIIPYLSLAVAAVISQHNTVIGRREAFIAMNLMPFLQERQAHAPFKEAILKDEKHATREITMRTIAHVIGLFLPGGVALILNFGSMCYAPITWVWWTAMGSSVAAFGFVWRSHCSRLEYAKNTENACEPATPATMS